MKAKEYTEYFMKQVSSGQCVSNIFIDVLNKMLKECQEIQRKRFNHNRCTARQASSILIEQEQKWKSFLNQINTEQDDFRLLFRHFAHACFDAELSFALHQGGFKKPEGPSPFKSIK